MFLTLANLTDDIHQLAREKGWYDPKPSLASQEANLHGEVSELWEAYRKGTLFEKCPKEGLELTSAEEEMADLAIRTLDTLASYWKDARDDFAFLYHNSFRHLMILGVPRGHESQQPLDHIVCSLHAHITHTFNQKTVEGFHCLLSNIAEFSAWLSIDLDRSVSVKHEYNRTRPYRHGGKLA